MTECVDSLSETAAIPIGEFTLGNCLELLPMVPNHSVNLILCDLPYGTTDNSWDSPLPLSELFSQYRRILASHGAIILTGQGLFSARLMMAGEKLYRYSLVWKKNRASGHLHSKRRPLRQHEDILVFYRDQPPYHPQKTPNTYRRRRTQTPGLPSANWGPCLNRAKAEWMDDGYRFPTSIISIDLDPSSKSKHPTGKPVALGEWLVQTYTNPDDLVLDHCCGSGGFILAAEKLGRRWIGIDSEPKYLRIAQERLNEVRSEAN